VVFRSGATDVTAVPEGGPVICSVSDADVEHVIRGRRETDIFGRGRLRRDGSDPVADQRPRSRWALPLELSHRTSVAHPWLRSNDTGHVVLIVNGASSDELTPIWRLRHFGENVPA